MSKHTPGPWVASTDPFKSTTYSTLRDHVSISAPAHGDLAQVVVLLDGKPSPECEANARLIAAAPDLLRLLQEARLTLDMWKDVAPAVSLCSDIDKAIAKAEGRA